MLNNLGIFHLKKSVPGPRGMYEAVKRWFFASRGFSKHRPRLLENEAEPARDLMDVIERVSFVRCSSLLV